MDLGNNQAKGVKRRGVQGGRIMKDKGKQGGGRGVVLAQRDHNSWELESS